MKAFFAAPGGCLFLVVLPFLLCFAGSCSYGFGEALFK